MQKCDRVSLWRVDQVELSLRVYDVNPDFKRVDDAAAPPFLIINSHLIPTHPHLSSTSPTLHQPCLLPPTRAPPTRTCAFILSQRPVVLLRLSSSHLDELTLLHIELATAQGTAATSTPSTARSTPTSLQERQVSNPRATRATPPVPLAPSTLPLPSCMKPITSSETDFDSSNAA